jgi:cytochrome P450
MRLYPSVQIIFLCEVTPQHGLEIEGREVPLGTEVACNSWVVRRNREMYGGDADVWRTERRLEEAGKKLEKYNPSLGHGMSSSFGKDLAMMGFM